VVLTALDAQLRQGTGQRSVDRGDFFVGEKDFGVGFITW
jgi:hypothetical protein